MFRPRRRGYGHRREGLGLILLLHQLYRIGFDRIPPVTLATVAANVLIYLRVLNPYIKAFIRSPSIKNICVSTAHVWYKGDWPRLLLAAWFHLDEWHLYYNMASFVWKGISLERKFGSPYFAFVILVFSALSNAVLIGLNIGLAELLEDHSHVVSCAAGFSGVIFALKVLTTYYTPAHSQRIMGLFSVPSRWACWVELVLIQLVVPRASFTGHLAGILVGLAYVKGPLKILMDAFWHLVMTVVTGGSADNGRFQPRSDTTGHRNQEPSSRPPNSFGGRGFATGAGPGSSSARPGPGGNPGGTSQNHRPGYETRGSGLGGASPTLPSYNAGDFTGGFSEEEQIQAAMQNSRSNGSGHPSSSHEDRPQPSAPPYPSDDASRLYPDLSREGGPTAPPHPHSATHSSGISADELRRRRLAHLNG